jgi:hypothetical protein
MKNRHTYIMFMELPDGKILFKIGHSTDVKKRLSSHKTSNPFITETFVLNADVETYLHCCFSKYRFIRRSEWFWMHDISIKDTMILIKDAFHYWCLELSDYGNKKIIDSGIAMEYRNKYLLNNKSVLDTYCDFHQFDYYQSIKVNRTNEKTQVKKIKDNLNNYRVYYQNTNK